MSSLVLPCQNNRKPFSFINSFERIKKVQQSILQKEVSFGICDISSLQVSPIKHTLPSESCDNSARNGNNISQNIKNRQQPQYSFSDGKTTNIALQISAVQKQIKKFNFFNSKQQIQRVLDKTLVQKSFIQEQTSFFKSNLFDTTFAIDKCGETINNSLLNNSNNINLSNNQLNRKTQVSSSILGPKYPLVLTESVYKPAENCINEAFNEVSEKENIDENNFQFQLNKHLILNKNCNNTSQNKNNSSMISQSAMSANKAIRGFNFMRNNNMSSIIQN